MNIVQACYQLYSGERVCRKSWGGKDKYYFYKDDQLKRCTPISNCGTTFSEDDTLATDWEVWQEPAKATPARWVVTRGAKKIGSISYDSRQPGSLPFAAYPFHAAYPYRKDYQDFATLEDAIQFLQEQDEQ